VTTVFFAGGGTGGHLMPALAVADAMVRLDPSVRPFFVGSRRGIEANVLPQRPWPYALLPLEPIRRRQWWLNVALPLSLWRSVREVAALVAKHKPALVVGTGGYAAGPVVWGAGRRGVPAVLQEQNAFPGLTTRRLAGQVRQIHLGFPEARRHLHPGAGTVVFDSGNPIQPPPAQRPDRRAAREKWGFSPDQPVVLVVGGSQGALPINAMVDAALAEGRWPAGAGLLWQVGSATFERFAARSERHKIVIRPFIDPIADAYAAADLVVGRAGAMTIAELCAWGLPAILIPLPTAAAGHQLSNARALHDAGAAVLLEQALASASALTDRIGALLGDPAGLAGLSQAALLRAHPDAADFIAGKALGILSDPAL
jgi:UDP-N-acetylglucosamine--N-acetylmuramyl-(pentapeptide) pyrophosphoryl-undecaprenol N-acetylglucosamine transferase